MMREFPYPPPDISGGIQAQAQPKVFFPVRKTVQTSRRQPSAIEARIMLTVQNWLKVAHCITLLGYCQWCYRSNVALLLKRVAPLLVDSADNLCGSPGNGSN